MDDAVVRDGVGLCVCEKKSLSLATCALVDDAVVKEEVELSVSEEKLLSLAMCALYFWLCVRAAFLFSFFQNKDRALQLDSGKKKKHSHMFESSVWPSVTLPTIKTLTLQGEKKTVINPRLLTKITDNPLNTITA